MDTSKLTVLEIRDMLAKGSVTSEQLVASYKDAFEKKNADINAYLEFFNDALDEAKKADQKRAELIAAGKNADQINADFPLLGVPLAMKDNVVIKDKVASAASKILEKYASPYDSTVTAKLKAAGAVFLGRVNMDEFAMGGSTENSAYGVTKNPHDTSRVSGGSSGGSAAVLAMGGAPASLGSDTGGSIRQPAAYNGVVGLKPTYGTVSRHGLMAMGSSLDVIGPLAHTVADIELLFEIIKNTDGDRYDSTSLTKKDIEKVAAEHSSDPAKLRVGIVPELMNVGGLDASVVEAMNKTVEALKAAGCEVKEVSLPHMKYSLAVYYILMPAEVSSNMARFDGVKYGSKVEGADLLGDYLNTRGELLGKEVRRRIMLGTYVLSSGYHDAYYNKANIVKDLIAGDFKKAFESVDVILTPTTPTPAFKIGSHTDDPVQMYLEDIFTVTANLVGSPALSVPAGFADIEGKKLPVGVQFTAPHCREDILFAVGKKVEQGRGF
ncbi:MAG TPA: Asp-tRNA(Asn)/Glu-tRNA(Gln) amidotransferase subunit GatA [Candidatus Paceibacterota bacterium]